ncbi:MAG: hypothetical protein N2Z79_01605, partial [Candidatus Omnitrophica bacterium]|nr:hypothetical protein [Candidatus Omnitrophota bacterium]
MGQLIWTKEAEEIFKKILNHLPQFHRSIAERLVKEKAEMIAEDRSLNQVSDREVIEAFSQEVPPAFRQMMERLFHQLGITNILNSDKK